MVKFKVFGGYDKPKAVVYHIKGEGSNGLHFLKSLEGAFKASYHHKRASPFFQIKLFISSSLIDEDITRLIKKYRVDLVPIQNEDDFILQCTPYIKDCFLNDAFFTEKILRANFCRS